MGELNLPEIADKDEIRQQYQAQMALLDDGIAQWPGMTANQKQTWLGANFDQVMRGQRAILRILAKMLG
jgi:hypothetical protein